MPFSNSIIDKGRLLRDLQDRVRSDLEALIRRQQDTQQGATHEENRSEHAKDTRATEQSYLARGLAARVEEMREISNTLAKVEWRRFDSEDLIAVTALVTLRDAAEIWWLVPGPGGIGLSQDEAKIRTLSPVAPLGRALIGLRIGSQFSFSTPRGPRDFEILDIA